jgi:hypothetical protein
VVRVIRAIVAVVALAGIVLGAPASAAPLTFTYGGVQTGDSPTGDPPWLTALFEDIGSNSTGTLGLVRLTLTGNLQDSEFITTVMFNLNPKLDAKNLNITGSGGTAMGSFTPPSGNDTIEAPGGSRFDFEFTFPTAQGTGRFTDDEFFETVLTYPILNLYVITTSDFDFLSAPNGNGALKKAARLDVTDGDEKSRLSLAHVQGIPGGGEGSGWLFATTSTNGVPEPGTFALIGIALAGFVATRRRTRH